MSATSTLVQPAVYRRGDLVVLLQRSPASIDRDAAAGLIPGAVTIGVGQRSRRWLRATVDRWISDGCPRDTAAWEARRAAQ